MLKKAAGVAAGVGEVIAPELTKELDKWKGWGKGIKKGADRFLSKDERLDDFLKSSGYVRQIDPGTNKPKKPRGTGKIRSIDVAELDFDPQGKEIAGINYNLPLIVKFEDNDWKIIKAPRRPRGGTRDAAAKGSRNPKDVGTPAAAPATPKDVGTAGQFGTQQKDVRFPAAGQFGKTPQKKLVPQRNLADSFSQKNLLRQLHMLRG